MKLRQILLSAVAGVCLATPASAHTSYILPNTFDATFVRVVTLESSFTDAFSRSEVGVKSQDWHVLLPDGTRRDFDNVVEMKQLTMLEMGVSEEGTYRFTTGERLGRSGQMIRSADGSLRPARTEEGETAAPGAGETLVSSQTATVAEVYVSKGAPTDTVVAAPAGRLVIRPMTHPNKIFAESGLKLQVSFDGQPLAGQELELSRDGSVYDDSAGMQHVKTDAEGIVTLSFDAAGIYLIMTRHQAEAPAGSETDIRSYTTSLTFDVTN